MRTQQRADRRAVVAGERERLGVVDLREAQAAVLRWDLHPQGADPLQGVDHAIGDLRVALDLERVNLRGQHRPELGEEALALLDRLGVQPRLRMDQIEAEIAEEQLLAEARELPLALSRRLDDVASFFL